MNQSDLEKLKESGGGYNALPTRRVSTKTTTSVLSSPLSESDPTMYSLIEKESDRQRDNLELIASENFCSLSVREALSSSLTNKYSEGLPGHRYYAGNSIIDEVETLCMKRALDLYKLNDNEWGVNVQPYSGSPANFAVYTALLNPFDRVMGLDLPSGGHLTHGYQTPTKKVSATSVYFNSMPYVTDKTTGLIDYDDMERRTLEFRPNLLIAGGSAYPREWDYKRMRSIADKVGAYLMTDMAHLSGLIAGGCATSPFTFSDVVTTTTHKSLRGPRSGMIFARKKEFIDKVNFAVFPGLQGGPHNNQIAAVAVALKEAASESFASYTTQVVKNSRHLASRLVDSGMVLATGGTDNHLFLWDARPLGLTGSKLERILELCSITVNKNSIHGDRSAVTPGGVRIGTPALTTRGMKEEDMDVVASFLVRAAELGVVIQSDILSGRGGGCGGENKKVTLQEFTEKACDDERVEALSKEVKDFSSEYHMP